MQKKILVVDDEPVNLKGVQQILQEHYQLVFAPNGDKAIEAAHKHLPDLILLDIQMPGMNGYEVCEKLKADPSTREIPVIFLTSMSEVADEARGFDVGAVDYIQKPVSAAILLRRVETHLSLMRILADIVERKRTENRLRELSASLERRATELQDSVKEKEAMLQEIHHRVKNNLQIVSSLLSLQSGYVRDPQVLAQFQESQSRIRAMALVHETLYQSERLTTMDLAVYLQSLGNILMRSYAANSNVKLEARLQTVPVSMDTAVPVGLMLNELVTNALKYAFPGERPGQLLLELSTEVGGQITLRVQDDGVGLKPDFQFEQASTLGLRLVLMFAKQLRANVTLRSEPGHTVFDIRFKEAAAKPS